LRKNIKNSPIINIFFTEKVHEQPKVRFKHTEHLFRLTDKKTRFEQKVSLDSEEGKIEFAKSDFSANKMERLMRKLEKKFEQNGWFYTTVQKKRLKGRTLLLEKWHCKDVDGNEFELSILREKCKDTHIFIEPTDENAGSRNAITIEIYNWLKEAAIGPS
jgi:hypothetical protein